jgi:hypothetical protein
VSRLKVVAQPGEELTSEVPTYDIQLIYFRNSSCQLATPPLPATHLQQSIFASTESSIHCLFSAAGVLIVEQVNSFGKRLETPCSLQYIPNNTNFPRTTPKQLHFATGRTAT